MFLTSSVGTGGSNLHTDVLRVQQALNIVRVHDKLSPIKVDGWIGPETIGAIQDFQRLHTQSKDGRIDRHGPSMRELERIVVPVVEARIRSAIVGILEGLAGELASRGLQLPPKIQDELDAIERTASGLQAGAGIPEMSPAIYYPQRQGPTFQLAFAVAAAPEAALLAMLALIAMLYSRA
jgi:hypothetical protein